jgi:DNA-binding PadR family transcriptional regulator
VTVAPLSTQAFHILVSLADRDHHGYGIMQDVAERTGGKLRLSAGTMYGVIRRLLEEGLISELRESQRPKAPTEDSRRRYYRLTALGRKAITAEVKRMTELTGYATACGLAGRTN